jgi:hypothetical protein
MNSEQTARVGVIAIALAFLSGAFPQGGRGTLTGTVTHPHGALMPNVQASIRQPETGTQFEPLATSTGSYSVIQLSAGTHALGFTGSGLQKYRLVCASPSVGNPFVTTTRDGQQNLTKGFGYINPLSSGTRRNGQALLRFQF